ncbi:hypothetical protein EDB89DRAFT_2072333 [Lactarius sanguifluus]|nr:hypothetical protein EDB89DRAFT_2072333 [Lactarius sanguifluus]
MQVSTRSPTDQRITDAARLAPYLTHVIRQHGQLALMPQETTSRSRKPRREKRPRQERQQRPPEEPHFNVGAPRTPRRIQPGSPGARSRPNRRPDVSDAGSIPDYPPPSFDEAVAAAAAAARNAPPLSPTDSTTNHSSFADSYQSTPILIPPLPRSLNQPVVAHTLPDPESSESLRYSTQAEYDDSGSDEDLEVISTSEATSSVGTWEQDSHIRIFPERAHLEVGTAPTSARTVRSSPSQLTLTPHLSESPQDDRDDITAYSPSTDSQGDDHTVEPHNSITSPVPPRRRLHLLSGLLKSRDHPASAPSTPTHAAASQLSLPIHFLNRPGSPSKSHRGEGLISRKLFGHKGKDRNTEPQIGGPPEPLDTWDMLSDVERETPPASGSGYPMPPVSPASEHFPSTPRQSESPGLRREGTRPKHHSMLNHPVPPPTSPLTPTATQRSHTHMDLRAAAVLASLQRQPTMFAVSATASASAAVPSPSSPSQRLPVQSTQVPLQPHTAIDSPTRGRSLRATASMIWSPRKHYSPVPSPTRSTTTPTSPSSASLQSGVTNVDYNAVTPATLVSHDQEAILGALPPSLVQEEEEENFVTPPGSPVRSLLTLPVPTISSSRHTSPVRHEGWIGVTLRDDGPVPSVSPARSEAHARTVRTPTITPRPSVNALHAFAPPNPSPLANQSFERQALIPPAPPSPTLPRRDTVMSVGDTESLIDLYVQSAGPASTPLIADSVAPAASTDSEFDEWMPGSSGDPKQYHYPGRPLPHPPGASQSGPVRPVLLDTFLAGNIPGGLPPYEEVELERQGLWHTLPFSRTKPVSNAPCLPPSPLVNQPGPRTPPRCAPPELFPVFDEDASEPSSPGSTYEMPPSTPSSTLREFASGPNEDDGNEATTTMGRHYREARQLSVTLPPYRVADRRSPAPAERVSRAGSQVRRARGADDASQDCSYDDGCDDQYDQYDGDDDAGGGCAVQREWSAAGTRRGGAATGDAQWARETQAGTAWRDRGPVRDVRDAVSRP